MFYLLKYKRGKWECIWVQRGKGNKRMKESVCTKERERETKREKDNESVAICEVLLLSYISVQRFNSKH